MKRGNAIHRAYAERLQAERLSQHATGGCAWCPDFRPVGTVEETRAASLKHRKKHHPETLELAKPKQRRRLQPMTTLVSNKTLDENVANARTQGASTWAGTE